MTHFPGESNQVATNERLAALASKLQQEDFRVTLFAILGTDYFYQMWTHKVLWVRTLHPMDWDRFERIVEGCTQGRLSAGVWIQRDKDEPQDWHDDDNKLPLSLYEEAQRQRRVIHRSDGLEIIALPYRYSAVHHLKYIERSSHYVDDRFIKETAKCLKCAAEEEGLHVVTKAKVDEWCAEYGRQPWNNRANPELLADVFGEVQRLGGRILAEVTNGD